MDTTTGLSPTVIAAATSALVVVGTLYACSQGSKEEVAEAEPARPTKKAPKTKASAKKVAAPEQQVSKKKKVKKTASGGAASPAAAPAEEAPAEPEKKPEPEPAPEEAPGKKKRARKKKSGGGNAGGGGGAPPTVADKPADDAAKPEAKADKPKTDKPKAAPTGDGWTSVDSSAKNQRKPKQQQQQQQAVPETPVVVAAAGVSVAIPGAGAASEAEAEAEEVKEEKPTGPTTAMLVDPRKLGVLIGPKGSTLKRIEELSGCRVQVDDMEDGAKSAGVKIMGPTPEACGSAEKMVREMCSKGYSAAMMGSSDFVESVVEVKARQVPDLVGSRGCVVVAIREKCDVQVTLPKDSKTSSGDGSKRVKVTIAGPKEGVAKAKQAIKDIQTKYYSTVTHPGLVHEEFKVEEWMIARFCGRAGANVRHIQGDSKARVYVPREESENKNVVVVGEPAQVAKAKKHITKILADIVDQAKRVSSEEAMASAHRASNSGHREASDEEEHEEWMNEYLYKR